MKSAMAEGTGGNHRWETDKTKRVRKQKEKGRSEEQEGALDAVRQRSGKFDPLVVRFAVDLAESTGAT